MPAEVRIVLSEERAGNAIKGVEGDLKSLGTTAETTGTKAKGFLGGLGGMLGSAAMTAGIGVAIAGVTALGSVLVGGIADARTSQQLMASTEQTITTMGNAAGRSAQDVADLASQLSDASGMSLFGDDQIQQSENLLLTFGNIKGETFDLATALTVDLAAALGGAPADQAMMLGKALNDPKKGLTALGKAGLTFSEEQKAMITALQDGGDMAGAQAIIIAELTKQVGGQAEAQAKAAGPMMQFKARMGEVAESAGALLLPMLDAVAGFLLDPVMPAIESVVAGVGPFIASFQTAGESSTFLSGAIAFLGGVWQQLQVIIVLAAQLIQATVIPIFTAIAGFIQAHSTEINTVLSAAWTSIKTVIETTLAIITGILQAALAVLRGDWQGAWDAIKGIFVTVWGAINTLITTAVDALKALLSLAWDAIKSVASTAWDSIKSAIATAFDPVKAAISGITDAVKGALDTIWGAIKGAASTAWDTIKSAAESAFSPVKGAISTISGAVKSALDTAWGTIKGAASTAWGGIKSAATTAFDPIKGAISTIAGNTKSGLDTAWSSISGAASTAWGGIKGAAETAFGPIRGAIDTIVNGSGGVKGILSSAWGSISSAASTAWGGIGGAISSAFSSAVGGIRGTLNSIISAMNSAIDAFNELPGPDIGHIPHIASGTSFFAGGLALVGEAGPELVVLPRGSQVRNASDTRAALAGQQLVFNIDARGATMNERQFEQVVRRMLADVASRADVRTRMV